CAHLAYCCLLVRHRGDRMEICGAAVDAMGERDSAHPDVSAQDFPIDAFSEARDKLNICSCERLRPGLNDCHTFASDLDTTHGSYGIRCCPSEFKSTISGNVIVGKPEWSGGGEDERA